jgi:hypothetical protein
VADYRNPDSALAARIETLDAERAELDAELERVLAGSRALSRSR